MCIFSFFLVLFLFLQMLQSSVLVLFCIFLGYIIPFCSSSLRSPVFPLFVLVFVFSATCLPFVFPFQHLFFRFLRRLTNVLVYSLIFLLTSSPPSLLLSFSLSSSFFPSSFLLSSPSLADSVIFFLAALPPLSSSLPSVPPSLVPYLPFSFPPF